MARQLEQAQYPDDGERLEQARLLTHPLAHVRVEAERRGQVDDVDRGSDEHEDVGGDLEGRMGRKESRD